MLAVRMDESDFDQQIRRRDHYKRMRDVLVQAKGIDKIKPDGVEIARDLDPSLYPTFRVGLRPLDKDEGLGQGVVVMAGDSGSGKSIARQAAGLENAFEGELVLDLNAEMPWGMSLKRIQRWLESEGMTLADFQKIWNSDYVWADFPLHGTWDHIWNAALEYYQPHHTGILVMFDSLNSILRRMPEPKGKGADAEWSMLYGALRGMDWVTQQSEGFIHFLALSEVNSKGEVYGGPKVKHAATVLLRLEEVEGSNTMTEIHQEKHREQGNKAWGKFVKDWESMQFVRRGSSDEG